MNSSLDSIPPVPSVVPLTSPQVDARAPSTRVDVPSSEDLSEVHEEDLIEESLSLGEFVDGLGESETGPPPLEGNETGISSSSDVGDLDKARYIDPSEVAGAGDDGRVLPVSSSGSLYPENDGASPSMMGASEPSHSFVPGSRAGVEAQSPPKGQVTLKNAGNQSVSGPSTPPSVSQPLSASPKKRARVWEGTSPIS
jgi:hypothetical protein